MATDEIRKQIIGYLQLFGRPITDATFVECEPMKDVFSPEQMQFFRKSYHAELKQCYKNSAILVGLIAHPLGRIKGFDASSVKYVEGFVYEPGLFPIEHAFVKVGDRYIDPTAERVLKKNVRKCQYVSFLELTYTELFAALEQRGYYGPLYQWMKDNRLQGKKR